MSVSVSRCGGLGKGTGWGVCVQMCVCVCLCERERACISVCLCVSVSVYTHVPAHGGLCAPGMRVCARVRVRLCVSGQPQGLRAGLAWAWGRVKAVGVSRA